MIWDFLSVFLGYLVGSIPWGYIAGRLQGGVDIREVGDGNVGAANVFRVLGAKTGISVGLADVGKGAAAILLARWMGVSEVALFLTGMACVVGHNWPLFLKLRGGRGASTTIGVLVVLLPRETFLLLGVAAISLLLTRNTIWACVALFAPLPFVAWWLGAPVPLVAYAMGLPSLVGFTHFLRTRGVPAPEEGHAANNHLVH